jgi:hypothetical protein
VISSIACSVAPPLRHGEFKPEEAYWDGDIVGTISVDASSLDSMPAFEGTVTAAAAWVKPPGEPVQLLGSAMIKAVATLRVGPTAAPTLLLRASTAFPIPCVW